MWMIPPRDRTPPWRRGRHWLVAVEPDPPTGAIVRCARSHRLTVEEAGGATRASCPTRFTIGAKVRKGGTNQKLLRLASRQTRRMQRAQFRRRVRRTHTALSLRQPYLPRGRAQRDCASARCGARTLAPTPGRMYVRLSSCATPKSGASTPHRESCDKVAFTPRDSPGPPRRHATCVPRRGPVASCG